MRIGQEDRRMSSQAISISPDAAVADVAVRHPRTIPVFERLGIDYCCRGARPLVQAVAEKGLDWQSVGAQLEEALRDPGAGKEPASWDDARLSELADYIVERYHAKLRNDLPLLTSMGERVIDAHGARHPELRDVAASFAGLRAELESHMMKEEHVLFPFIRLLEAGSGSEHPMLGRIASPISVMEAEHDSAGAALATLRAATSNYDAPADACPTLRGYYDGLATLERELHEHIHLENNVLFPRARQVEADVLGAH
jgi:regulator of cell morphogenesis and NO signaling